jgi:hypothetical protein
MTAKLNLRRYVKHGDAHYGGGLVDGAYVLGLFGDVATEACVRMDGDVIMKRSARTGGRRSRS